MMRPSGKLKRFMSNADYQVSTKRTKKKNPAFRVKVGAAKKQITCANAITTTFTSLSLSVGR
jgi:hypothetical protein